MQANPMRDSLLSRSFAMDYIPECHDQECVAANHYDCVQVIIEPKSAAPGSPNNRVV
jgi:hypothetical protein